MPETTFHVNAPCNKREQHAQHVWRPGVRCEGITSDEALVLAVPLSVRLRRDDARLLIAALSHEWQWMMEKPTEGTTGA